MAAHQVLALPMYRDRAGRVIGDFVAKEDRLAERNSMALNSPSYGEMLLGWRLLRGPGCLCTKHEDQSSNGPCQSRIASHLKFLSGKRRLIEKRSSKLIGR